MMTKTEEIVDAGQSSKHSTGAAGQSYLGGHDGSFYKQVPARSRRTKRPRACARQRRGRA
jgi:hypothetical protein